MTSCQELFPGSKAVTEDSSQASPGASTVFPADEAASRDFELAGFSEDGGIESGQESDVESDSEPEPEAEASPKLRFARHRTGSFGFAGLMSTAFEPSKRPPAEKQEWQAVGSRLAGVFRVALDGADKEAKAAAEAKTKAWQQVSERLAQAFDLDIESDNEDDLIPTLQQAAEKDSTMA
eukprot:TRINITY_DN13802_c2_g1_i2.p1 TRINITY_DN13802_c2_g1~~TRINITY_DN13802_c2_g1_i2.p1  ORF type:complete len:179 (-),score=58.47 TRINITY_DN13802_c2_g1_i2:179-715(-)